MQDWTASVAVKGAVVHLTLKGEEVDERSVRDLTCACARLHNAVQRSSLSPTEISARVEWDTCCRASVTLQPGCKLSGVFADLAACNTDSQGDATSFLVSCNAPRLHVLNALAFELDVSALPAVFANGATLVHVLEVRFVIIVS